MRLPIYVPSKYPHPVYHVKVWEQGYDAPSEERVAVGDTATVTSGDANLVSSQIAGTSMHTVMLDLDVPATLVESTTPGHSHLYVDVAIPWRRYRRLLRALMRAGVIEYGYYKHSCRRRNTSLRIPGVTKETL